MAYDSTGHGGSRGDDSPELLRSQPSGGGAPLPVLSAALCGAAAAPQLPLVPIEPHASGALDGGDALPVSRGAERPGGATAAAGAAAAKVLSGSGNTASAAAAVANAPSARDSLNRDSLYHDVEAFGAEVLAVAQARTWRNPLSLVAGDITGGNGEARRLLHTCFAAQLAPGGLCTGEAGRTIRRLACELLQDVVGAEALPEGSAEQQPAAAPVGSSYGMRAACGSGGQVPPSQAAGSGVYFRVRDLVRWSLRLALQAGAAEGPLSLQIGDVFKSGSPVQLI
ncbi:hypothetical protein GPECTOR_2g1068 [Gonium pectorale]|uniref:Uncharacterized protein n=1 Tax=Gonium pectorale TaxID=33097 RepID=A0A150H075_GONPE|nr:hypothetical protein GPECTOR_2g1068 [Gonium pectorale]|eukprot:KXZ55519.1 hypothetical protein GPECTOR_2g1068 [Gonium pectorale]